jgi:hypothetical protein
MERPQSSQSFFVSVAIRNLQSEERNGTLSLQPCLILAENLPLSERSEDPEGELLLNSKPGTHAPLRFCAIFRFGPLPNQCRACLGVAEGEAGRYYTKNNSFSNKLYEFFNGILTRFFTIL